MNKLFILIGGGLNVFTAIAHVMFWKTFGWPESILPAGPDNTALVQVLDIHTTLAIAFFAVISFVFHRELLTTRLGRWTAAFIAIFYLVRLVEEPIFWDPCTSQAMTIYVLCLAFAALYLIPLWRTRGTITRS